MHYHNKCNLDPCPSGLWKHKPHISCVQPIQYITQIYHLTVHLGIRSDMTSCWQTYQVALPCLSKLEEF